MILQVINPFLQTLANTVGVVLLPLFKILQGPLKILSQALRTVAEVVIGFWNALVSVIDAIPFVNVSHWKVSMDELDEAMGDTADSAKEAADAMRNIPQGVKIAQRAFQVARPVPSAATGGYVASSGIAEVHKGEVIANKSQQGATYVFQGDVYGWNDFKKKVAQANGQIKRKQNTSKYGISRGERR